MRYQRRRLARALSLPHLQPAAGRPASPWGKPEMFWIEGLGGLPLNL